VHLVHHLVEEVVAGDPLADQPALHVDEAGEHGIDRPRRHVGLQGLEIQIADHDTLSRRSS
jgi:hypothetical protein